MKNLFKQELYIFFFIEDHNHLLIQMFLIDCYEISYSPLSGTPIIVLK